MIKRIIAACLSFILCLGMLPATAFAKEDAYTVYMEAVKATMASGSWSEELTMTADMAIEYGTAKTKTKASINSKMNISNYSEDDISTLYMSGSADMSVMGQKYAWNITYENGIAHYQYTEPEQSSMDVAMDPSYFNFETVTSDMFTKAKVSRNKITFTIPGEKMEAAEIAAVNMMSGIDNLHYGDVAVEVTTNADTGTIETMVMNFPASLTFQGYDAEVDYHIDYAFSRNNQVDAVQEPDHRDVPTTEIEDGLVVYSDYSNLSIRKDAVITLSAGIIVAGEQQGDISGITFQIEDTSILQLSDTGTKDGCRYVKLKAHCKGTTTVVFNDTNTGDTVMVPITVYENNLYAYTLSTVPTLYIEEGIETNFYNVNGLYIDCYDFEVKDNQSAIVSFDVYNTNYSYGVVEVFDENGYLKNAVLIDKMASSNTSIKEAVWDNTCYLIKDIFQGTAFTYRQESGFSKKTPGIKVEIPPNGYIKISTDPTSSSIVGVVNYAVLLLSILELTDEITKFDVNSKAFSEKLTAKLLNEKIFSELVNDNEKMAQKLWKNIGKETLISKEAMGSFIDTAIQNLSEFGLMDVIMETAYDCGWDIGESVFTDLSGPFGIALKIIFSIGKVENIAIQYHDTTQNAGAGYIYIQNQGGGLRSCQQITVESDELSDDTALSVYTVTLDSGLLDIIKDVNPDIYESMKDGITYTYNISLLKNGEETQPDGKVTVYIPIPEDLKALAYVGKVADKITGKVKIYRVEDDGNLAEMDVEIKDGCFAFTTSHFSLYTVVGYDPLISPIIKHINGIGIPILAVGGTVAIAIVSTIIFVLIHGKKRKYKPRYLR